MYVDTASIFKNGTVRSGVMVHHSRELAALPKKPDSFQRTQVAAHKHV